MYLDRRKGRRKMYAWPVFYVAPEADQAQSLKGEQCVDTITAGHILKVTPAAVHQLVRRGTLKPYARISRGPLFKLKEVQFLAWERGVLT